MATINPKKIAALALGPADDGADEDETDGGTDDASEGDEGGDAASEEFAKALKGGVASEIHAAFHNLIETCYPGVAKLK